MSSEAVSAPMRPEPPRAALPGTHWEAVEAGSEWGVAEDGKTCRWRGSREPGACGNSARVRVRRGVHRPVDWNYCGPHGFDSYGVWAENGKVMTWKLADDPPRKGRRRKGGPGPA